MSNTHKSSGVVSGDVRPKHFKQQRWLIVGGIAALITVLAGARVLFLQPEDKPPVVATQNTDNEAKRIGSAAEAHKLRGDYDKAVEVLSQAIAKNPSDQDKEYYYIYLGGLYEIKEDYAKALDAYRKAEALPQATSKGVALGIARTAEKANDKKTAIEYYRQVYSIISLQNQASSQEKQYYEQTIKKLGGTL